MVPRSTDRSRRKAPVADRGLGRLNWADSGRTRAAGEGAQSALTRRSYRAPVSSAGRLLRSAGQLFAVDLMVDRLAQGLVQRDALEFGKPKGCQSPSLAGVMVAFQRGRVFLVFGDATRFVRDIR